MLKNPMYIAKAHRLSEYPVSSTVGEIRAGQLFHLNNDGEWEYADGTRKAYPTINNRFQGQGLGPQGERLEGLDDVSRSGKIACFAGNFEIHTDQFDDTKTYTYGAPLKAGAAGKAVPFETATDDAAFIIGYVTRVPADNDDFLGYQG